MVTRCECVACNWRCVSQCVCPEMEAPGNGFHHSTREGRMDRQMMSTVFYLHKLFAVCSVKYCQIEN